MRSQNRQGWGVRPTMTRSVTEELNNQETRTCWRPLQRKWARRRPHLQLWSLCWPSGLDLSSRHQTAGHSPCSPQSLYWPNKTQRREKERERVKGERAWGWDGPRAKQTAGSGEFSSNPHKHPRALVPLSLLSSTPATAKNKFAPSRGLYHLPRVRRGAKQCEVRGVLGESRRRREERWRWSVGVVPLFGLVPPVVFWSGAAVAVSQRHITWQETQPLQQIQW